MAWIRWAMLLLLVLSRFLNGAESIPEVEAACLANGFSNRDLASITCQLRRTGTPAPVQSGQIEQLQVTAVDANGLALANLPVTVSVAGPNGQTRVVTTDATGKASFAYVGTNYLTGTDTVVALANVGGADTSSNAVAVNWNNGTNQAPVVSGGGDLTVQLPGTGVLNGSVTDDGLPGTGVTATWTVVSGPGTVTFDNAGQAVTGVQFSVAGTYVLRLTGSDGTLSGNATVTVTVRPISGWNSGWLSSGLDGASVSGLVPVTLASGVTLTGGTLSYYPANNQSAITVLNNNTTGSGTVGTLDTTLLNNGAYFVQLTATNSAGVTQTNLALVTVVGDYKPGRVTATVTDFTVPSAGLAIQVQRTYDSLLKGESGDFGYGWRLGLNAVNLAVSANGDVTLTIGGRRRTFYFTPQPNAIFQGYYLPQYTGEPGMYGSLTSSGDACAALLVRTGNIYTCAIQNAGAVFSPTGYQYTDPYGRVYTLAANGALQSLKDLNNNTLTLTASGITSTTGLSVPFVRDAQGRITQITDTAGNVYQYAYDAAGNLGTVTFPALTLPTIYGYDAKHLLTSEKDPRGNTGSTTYYSDGKVQSVTDAAGQVTNYAYNLATRTNTVTNPDGGTVVTVNDAYGMPLSVTDPLGRVTAYTYDAAHNRLTETNPLSQTTTYTYDAGGFRTSLKDALNNIYGATYNVVGEPVTVTNPLNQTQTVTYDANFNLSKITDSLGAVAEFTYNTKGLPLTLKDARPNTSSYAYDAYGNRTSTTDPLGRVTATAYDTMGRVSSTTDPRGNVTAFGYDGLGRKTSMTDPYAKVTTYGYDGNNNKTSETDPLGRVTTFTYDSVNRMTGTTYPDGTTKSWTYDFRGNKLTETDQLGRVTKWTYDLAGQLTSVVYAFGTADAATESMTYDLAGRKLTQTDGRGNVTTYTYDAAGRMSTVRDAVGNVTTYGYDGKGQRTSLTDAKGRVTTYTYDARGRQLVTTNPDGSTTAKAYDGLGLVTGATDEEGRVTQYVYDAASQLTKVIDSLNQQTQYGYDLSGNKVSQTDANNHVTTYVYDKLNRRTSRTLPVGMSESMTYDFVGNVTAKTDFNGKVTSYTYDSLNRLLAKTPDASFVGAAAVVMTYTATGQRATMVDAAGSSSYTYDSRDRLKTKATPQGTLAYTYDAASNVTGASSSNANGVSVTYGYDANNRLSSVVDARTGGTTSYAYDATNRVTTVTYPNGVVHTNTYDTRDRMTGVALAKAGVGITSYGQTYSVSSHKTAVTESSGRAMAYTYDAIYRLLGETITGNANGALNGALTYGLDPVGNRLSLTSTLAALQSQALTYDANDRLSADTYDANGNTLTSGGHAFGYEFEDRLTSYDAGAIAYVYDGDGNRVARTQGGSTTRFLVDELTPTGYAQVAEEVVAGFVTKQYTHGLARVSLRQSVAGNWQTSYYGYDGFGSTRVLLDAAGAVTDTWAYDGFGNVVDRTGATPNDYLYRGEGLDQGTGMYYLRARWYRPGVGRFLTRDWYEGQAADPLSLNSYGYAEANSIQFSDPSGYSIVERIFGTGIGNIGRQVFSFFNVGMRGVSLGRVRAGAKLAYDTICCLDKAWSVLDLALTVVTAMESEESGIAYRESPVHVALSLIDMACRMGVPCRQWCLQRSTVVLGQLAQAATPSVMITTGGS